jgi:hypothetical protein
MLSLFWHRVHVTSRRPVHSALKICGSGLIHSWNFRQLVFCPIIRHNLNVYDFLFKQLPGCAVDFCLKFSSAFTTSGGTLLSFHF